MKKRFKNNLKQNGKKNGIFILVCAAVITISFGTLAGCSIAKTKEDAIKEDATKENIIIVDTETKEIANESDQSEREDVQTKPMSDDHSLDEDRLFEETMVLIFSKEGEEEPKQASLAAGNGYAFYLPDDEMWHLSGPDLWITDKNEQIALWVTHFEGESIDSVHQKLESDSYEGEENDHKWKQNGDLMYHVQLKEFEGDVWGIFYSYPTEFEEGWGRELPVIVDTFTLLDEASKEEENQSDGTGEYLGSEDCQRIKSIVDEFAAAYFGGDVNQIQQLLASTYEGKIDTYEGAGEIRDFTVKGLSDGDEKKIENGWKIQSYGLEG